eukprot:GDKI01018157.1.p1 GENE.GDKI01018157.1~~GDKI01018157.1.p1  ORF type:complete len:126 (-),score=5.66 GDKI01018157.1:111-455(-)
MPLREPPSMPELANCSRVVLDRHPTCEHEIERKCHVEARRIECQRPTSVTCDKCLKPIPTTCHVKNTYPDSVPCQERCSRKLPCGHPCPLECRQDCSTAEDSCVACEVVREQAT